MSRLFSNNFKKERGDLLIFENICRVSEKRGISIKRLEEKSGLKNGAIGKWRTSSPTVKNLQKVADALGVSVNTLLREEKKEEGD